MFSKYFRVWTMYLHPNNGFIKSQYAFNNPTSCFNTNTTSYSNGVWLLQKRNYKNRNKKIHQPITVRRRSCKLQYVLIMYYELKVKRLYSCNSTNDKSENNSSSSTNTNNTLQQAILLWPQHSLLIEQISKSKQPTWCFIHAYIALPSIRIDSELLRNSSAVTNNAWISVGENVMTALRNIAPCSQRLADVSEVLTASNIRAMIACHCHKIFKFCKKTRHYNA